ncbi:MAG: hypothetical protein WBL74_03670 [Novosphingobium sp.]|uniref:hypothetical protein n=1 Tax=Novosphingobium sp. TaxID=1874826 RepID=UPI003C7CECA1
MMAAFESLALLLAPALIAWLLLLFLTRFGPTVRILSASIFGGMIVSGQMFWEDWATGFCCREYAATICTESPMLILNVMIFALLGLVPLSSLELIRSSLRK